MASLNLRWRVALTLALLGACSDDEMEGPMSSAADEAMLEEFVAASCDRIRGCCEAEGHSTEALDDCGSTFFPPPATPTAFSEGRVTIDAQEFDRCITELRAPATRCEQLSFESCVRFLEGRVPEGGSCLRGYECALGPEHVACLGVHGDMNEEPGTCAMLARAAEGEPCILSSRDAWYPTTLIAEASVLDGRAHAYCDFRDNLYCKYPDTTCQRIRTVGETCNDWQACELALYCDGTCKPRKTVGETCVGMDPFECGDAMACISSVCSELSFGSIGICESGFASD